MKILFENKTIRICKNPNDSTFRPKYLFFIREVDDFKNEYWSHSDETPGLVNEMAEALIKETKE
jgi:hypothetical protein